MCPNVSSTTLQGWRERPPSSYSLKIQNFSVLEKSTLSSDGKYKSRLFSSGGYNWRMVIHPKGNDKDDGSRFISMYVEIDSTSLLSTPPSEVFADLRFFIFNKKENKYFTIQDVESKPFNIIRTVWGISQVLPLFTLNDPKNGYIFGGDQCEFGVDVIVAPPPTNSEILSFNDKLSYPKFSWTLKNFSELKEKSYTSSIFSMGERNWTLLLYPKGYGVENGKWLSIFLSLADGKSLKEDDKIFTVVHFRILDPYGSNHVTEETNSWHTKSKLSWGQPEFVALSKISKAYLDKEGSLNVEIKFDVVSETKYSLP